MEPFKIFVSHRHEDAKIAVRLADILRKYSDASLELYIGDSVEPSGGLHSNLMELLERADLLLLLLTEPSDLSYGWDWSLFEVGLFSGTAGGTEKRVIAL